MSRAKILHPAGAAGIALPLASILCALAASACTKDVISSYPVELHLLGNPEAVTVTMEWEGGTDTLEVPADGAATFPTRVPPGSNLVVRGPADCRFANADASLAITSADEPTMVALACPGVLELTALDLSVTATVARTNLSFTVTLGALMADPNPVVNATPRPKYAAAIVKVNGVSLAGAAGSEPLIAGATNIIEVSYPGHAPRKYMAELRRATEAAEKARLPGAAANGKLGSAIAADGAFVAVAEPGVTDGRVAIYQSTPTGWVLDGTVTADPAAGAASGFGAALAMSGTTLVVGAPSDDSDAADVGAIYVFARQNGSWNRLRRLTSLLPLSGYGSAVAVSPAGLIAVGSPNETRGQGAAYAYANFGDINQADRVRLIASNADDLDHFGTSVAISGTIVLVGAPDEDGGTAVAGTDNSATDAGAVYKFVLGSAGAAYLKGPRAPGEHYGQFLASSPAAVLIARRGSSSAFDTFTPTVASRYTTTLAGSLNAISLDGDRVAVGQTLSGNRRVTVYRLDSSAVQMAPPFTGSGASGADDFAAALALRGNRLFVGAALQGAQAQGAFYVFE
jgi:FG-GAP repeat